MSRLREAGTAFVASRSSPRRGWRFLVARPVAAAPPVAAALAVAAALGAGCSTAGEGPSTGAPATVRAASSGDSCTRSEGVTDQDGRPVNGPAGLAIARAEVHRAADRWTVTFVQRGPVVPGTTLVVFQGEVGGPGSFELRAADTGGGRWAATVAVTGRAPSPVDTAVRASGARVSWNVPTRAVPEAATVRWVFGSRAVVGGRVLSDLCDPATPVTVPR